MRGLIARIFNDQSQEIRGKIASMYTLLLIINVTLWALTLLVSTQYAVVLGTALLAFSFGLRHGVDADHIAAIDNVTRKLMQDGKRPVAVGFFFSLGHSTVVVLLSILVAIAAAFVQSNLPQWKETGTIVGTFISGAFLYVIGFINLLVLLDIYRMFRRVTTGGAYSEETLETFLANRGMMNRFFGPIVRQIDRSWKMYPLGFLFGLGFDTASEVALLGISAAAGGAGMPLWIVILFPLLFAAGMSLVDTTDSIMMLGAYGWAFVKPVRKLYYNMIITFVSVLIAVVIGTVEFLSIIASQFKLTGDFWALVSNLDFGTIGVLIIGIFILAWVGSTVIYRVKNYDAIEASTEQV
ncbi:MAG: HoxN/HupN/NixA family nickel/cobalt transporter [Chloroflexia bacterium]